MLRLKKGKGNETPSYDSQTSVERRKILAHKISINGETVDYAQDELNIHDYAEFERSDELIPEFRLSIKSKGPPPKLTRQKQSLDEGTGVSGENEANTSASAVSPKKTRSFQNIARQVCLMEHALKMWPGRNRERHHSSSSEDLVDLDKETDTDTFDVETASVHTDTSLLSGTEIIDIDDIKGRVDSGEAVNGNSNANTESSIRQRASQSTTNTDNVSQYLHDNVVVVKHEHGLVRGKSDVITGKSDIITGKSDVITGISEPTITNANHESKSATTPSTSKEEKKCKEGKLRCPMCVVL